MKLRLIVITLAFVIGLALPAFAADQNTDPLFISLTTDEGHRSEMGIGFGKSQYERGHFVTIFLNDKAVLLAAKSNEVMYAKQQQMLKSIIDQGGQILICPTCLQFYGLDKSDILVGIQVSNPDITGKALFSQNIRTLTW